MRKAFTLIELLVVIAIIAILAAILFPVFAQAKQAAKKTQSISNAKQLSLGVLMYSGDADDLFPVAVAWENSGAPAFFGGVGYQPWSWLVIPYIKTGGIFQDPTAPPKEAWPSVWNPLTTDALAPQYGYNYVYLSPLNGPSPTTSTFNPISQTALGNVAETVLLASKFSSSEDNQAAASGTYWYGPRSITTATTVEVPECATIPQWCFDNWGVGSFYDTTYLRGNYAAGALTGGNSVRGAELTIVAWADGHVSAKKPSALAAGTNWTKDLASSALVTNDKSKYVWDNE
jgi:prepilin-type N-terminal cleavage/methylation domain-containing protein/prepilin-type processing-associated H-X9-DG protein